MKIIKRAELKRKNRLAQFSCPFCGSRLEEYLDKMPTRFYRNEEYYCFVCPVCHENCMVNEGQICGVTECTNKTKDMSFREAWLMMLNGRKIKLPLWEGYWAWENGTIMMHCRNGEVLDIRQTDNPEYTFSNIASRDWMVVDETPYRTRYEVGEEHPVAYEIEAEEVEE